MTQLHLPQESILVNLKFGIKCEPILIDRSDSKFLDVIKKHATELVLKEVGSLTGDNRLHHLQLFLISSNHEIPSLKLLKRANDLTPACSIEIVIWQSDIENASKPRDHVLFEHNYKKPTYCSHCDYFMWGLIKQVCTSRCFKSESTGEITRFAASRASVAKCADKIFITNVPSTYLPTVVVRMREVATSCAVHHRIQPSIPASCKLKFTRILILCPAMLTRRS